MKVEGFDRVKCWTNDSVQGCAKTLKEIEKYFGFYFPNFFSPKRFFNAKSLDEFQL